MNSLRRHVTFLVFLTLVLVSCKIPSLPPAIVGECTHYVDNRVQADGDGSLDTPWNNISGHVDDLEPGNVMCVRGETELPGRAYTEPPIVCDNDGPTTLRTYPGEYVVLNNTPAGWKSTLILDADYWTVSGLWFDKDFAPGTQIEIRDASHILIEDCYLTRNGGDGAIAFPSTFSSIDVTIDGVIIHDTYKSDHQDSHGILIAGTREITVSNSKIYDIRGDCITPLKGDVTLTVINCHLYTTLAECSENALDVKTGRIVIVDSEMYGFRYCNSSCGSSGGGIGAAIITHMETVSITIEGNEIYDCASGIKISSVVAPSRIAGNVIHHLVIDESTWLNTGLYVHNNHRNMVSIYGNTFHSLPGNLVHFGPDADIVLENNVFWDTNEIYIASDSDLAYDYNGWFESTHTLPGEHDTISNDPLLTDDYYPLSNSPVRGAGKDGIDLGAFQYQDGGTSEPSPTTTQWWDYCPTCEYPVQPTYTPRPTPTCRPCLTQTPYPTSTSYPIQP